MHLQNGIVFAVIRRTGLWFKLSFVMSPITTENMHTCTHARTLVPMNAHTHHHKQYLTKLLHGWCTNDQRRRVCTICCRNLTVL